VDGVIFVADSQNERFEANLESLADMMSNLKDYNISFQNLPYLLQLNKRDLPNITPADEMVRALRKKDEPVIESIALKGTGVVETLKKVSKMVMMNVRQKLK
jgi:signal recognition particle receptor subunit beta